MSTGALASMIGGNHYHAEGNIQPVQFYNSNPHLNFQQCNMIKYAFRHKEKKHAEDLLKVVHYALLECQFQYPEDYADFCQNIADLIGKE